MIFFPPLFLHIPSFCGIDILRIEKKNYPNIVSNEIDCLNFELMKALLLLLLFPMIIITVEIINIKFNAKFMR